MEHLSERDGGSLSLTKEFDWHKKKKKKTPDLIPDVYTKMRSTPVREMS